MNQILGVGLWIGVSILVILIVGIGVFCGMVPVKVWVKAMVSHAYIPSFKLVGMKLRNVDVALIVGAYINAKKAGVKNLSIVDLETHYMAGGNVERVVEALIIAQGAKINLSVANAKAIDLANRDILQAVQNCVTPVVVTSPAISAVACDGIELIVKVRITLHSNIEKLIGGAGVDTILARVGEGVVTAVGSAKNHQLVLENPDSISKSVLEKGLDQGTAFEILSLDIADIDIGRNIGAKLQAERAEADVQIAHAKAEERRALAVAAEQEMKAKTQEMKAKLVSAQSEVPRAIGMAFKSGNIGVMDYYRMQNIQADSYMRNAIGDSKGGTDNNF
ncbi:MAG: flotillin-like protein FloA [Clostridia bacterium]|nr:flotillin-like protein FloA [Clostridia bacterium]